MLLVGTAIKVVEEAMDEVDSVGGFRQLFLGTNYKNLGVLRSELVKPKTLLNVLQKPWNEPLM